jgi:anti-sigma factor RsiW
MNTHTNRHPDELLAWYVNGTLAGAERAQVDEHLHSCTRCRDEVVFLRSLRHGIQSLEQPSPGDLGLKRLLRDVRARRTSPQQWWRPALAAAAVVIVAQGALLATFWPREPAITPLGAAKLDGAVAQVQFQPAATEAQIRALLQQAGATLIDGPGAIGVYRVRLIQPDAALAQLRARTDVVKHVALE